jgi:hypothetical protein
MIDALIDRGHTSYREISQRAFTLTLERAGIRHTQDEVQYLVSQGVFRADFRIEKWNKDLSLNSCFGKINW